MVQAKIFELLVVSLAFLDRKAHAVIVAFTGYRRDIRLFLGLFDCFGFHVFGVDGAHDGREIFAAGVDVVLAGVVVIDYFRIKKNGLTHKASKKHR